MGSSASAVAPHFSYRLATRGFAKILQWEPDTPFAEQMQPLKEAQDFLSFCMANSSNFKKRDWIAALTFLTTRKGLRSGASHSLRVPQLFKEFNDFVVDNIEIFENKFHLVLHRYGVLAHGPTVWRLLPELEARCLAMSAKEIALCFWTLARTSVHDPEMWALMERRFLEVSSTALLRDVATVGWAYGQAAPHITPSDELLKEIDRLVNELDLTGAHDITMMYRALATIHPKSAGPVHAALVRGMESQTLGFRAQEITTLWATFADMKVKDTHAIDLLCEESRRLRLDSNLDQNMVVVIGKAIKRMQCADPRIIYQLVYWVQQKGESLKAEKLLEVCELFSAMGIDDEKAWKRLGVRAQKKAIDLKLEEVRRLRHCFVKIRRMNDRIAGVLQLFAEIREDEMKYGPA